jgi:hypothetical protein
MSRDVCGICWCPYDEDGKCGCENVQVINPAPSKVMRGTCIRCGKAVRSDDIHTCTPPPGSELALILEQNEQLRQQNTELDVKLAGLEDRIQAVYGQLNDTEKEVDDLRLLLRQALAQLEINRTNFLKGPSKSICKMLAGGNDEAITAIKERLNDVN